MVVAAEAEEAESIGAIVGDDLDRGVVLCLWLLRMRVLRVGGSC